MNQRGIKEVNMPKLYRIHKNSQLHKDTELELSHCRYLCENGLLEGLLNVGETAELRQNTGEISEILARALKRGVTEEAIKRLIFFSVARMNIIEVRSKADNG